MSIGGTWVVPALLGAFHGLNPAMGWLFAVALGLQEGRRAAVLRALPPIVLGHAASVALVLLAVVGAQAIVSPAALRWSGGLLLLGFAATRLSRRRTHPRWVGMRVGFRDLTLWSFLMASAHGAGLMLVPLLLHVPAAPMTSMASHSRTLPAVHALRLVDLAGSAAAPATAVLAAHTLALLVVTMTMALAVYEIFGLQLLRRAWVNVDAIWTGALFVAAGITLAAA